MSTSALVSLKNAFIQLTILTKVFYCMNPRSVSISGLFSESQLFDDSFFFSDLVREGKRNEVREKFPHLKSVDSVYREKRGKYSVDIRISSDIHPGLSSLLALFNDLA